MEQLTEQEKNKQRRIYKWCMAGFALEGVLLMVLVCVLTILKDRALHNIVGFTLVGSFIPVLIAAGVLSSLKITQHVETSRYSLPYKLGKEKVLFVLFGGIALLMSIMMMPAVLSGRPFAMDQYKGGPEIFSLPSWTILPLVVWGPVGFIVLLATWHGVILFNDHLCYYIWWMKRDVFYRDMKRVEVNKRATGKGGSAYIMTIHHVGAGKSPLEVSLAITPAKDCAIMLDVIQRFSPDVVMDELAQQMKQGEFPVV